MPGLRSDPVTGPTRARPPATDLAFLLWQAALRWQSTMGRVLAPFELTYMQYLLLTTTLQLNRSGHDPNQSKVGQYAGTHVVMTSDVIRLLERRELVTRYSEANDTRSKRLRVTPRGARLAAAARDAVEAADAHFFEAVSEADATRVLTILAGEPADWQADQVPGPRKGPRRPPVAPDLGTRRGALRRRRDPV